MRCQTFLLTLALLTCGRVATAQTLKFYGEPDAQPKEVRQLTGHSKEVLDALLLPDGTLMTAGADGTLRTWDVASGKQTALIAEKSDPITKLMFGPIRGEVLSFSASGAISVWQLPQSKRPWGPEQAIGPPDSSRGDQQSAWASETEDNQAEWLILEYAEPVAATAIRIHENFNPGAIEKITVFDVQGNEVEGWARPESDDNARPRETAEPLEAPLRVGLQIKRVKLHIESQKVPGWNEIDAVGLVDAKGKVHWATAAAASSTYADRRNNYRQPPVRMAPAPVYKIPAGAERLSHVDETAEGKQSYGGSGHAVEFQRPRNARYVVAIEVFGSRYGYPQPPDEDFEVLLMDSDHQVIKRLAYPYALFQRGEEKWVVLGVAGVEVPRNFLVALNFNAHQTKGVYVGKDESVEKSHSLVGTTKAGFKRVDDNYDWMIRVHVAERPPEDDNALSLNAAATTSAASR